MHLAALALAGYDARTVHYIEGTHSATRIHAELQEVHVGDRLNTGSIGKKFAVGNPVTVIEPRGALAIGTWAFVLRPLRLPHPASGPRPRLGLPAGRRPTPACAAAGSARCDRLPHRRPAALRHGTQNDARPETARRICRRPTRSRRIRGPRRPLPYQQPAVALTQSATAAISIPTS